MPGAPDQQAGLLREYEGTAGGLLRVPNFTDIILSMGGWAGGTFPFDEDAADITISGATTWNDSAGFKRVGLLTINASQTLTIARSPFFIFAKEINFGGTDSIIDGSGPAGTTGPATFSTAYARGNSVSGAAVAQGGCGGILLVIVAGRISGAAGVIKVDGGAAARNTTSGGNQSSGGQGALSANLPSTGAVTAENYTTLGIQLQQGDGGGSANTGRGGGSGGNSALVGGGGSGTGGGGGTDGGGSATLVALSPVQILQLAAWGCLGGGGGAAHTDNTGTSNAAGGGGGGALMLYVQDLQVTPTTQANGGAGIGAGGAGAAGQTILVDLK
jgi:hypothetical protein